MRGHYGGDGGVGDVRGVWGDGRDCRYSGTRRVIGASEGIEEFLGGVGAIWGVLGCQVYWGLAGTLGTQGPKRYGGIRVLGAPRGVGGCLGVSGCIESWQGL